MMLRISPSRDRLHLIAVAVTLLFLGLKLYLPGFDPPPLLERFLVAVLVLLAVLAALRTSRWWKAAGVVLLIVTATADVWYPQKDLTEFTGRWRSAERRRLERVMEDVEDVFEEMDAWGRQWCSRIASELEALDPSADLEEARKEGFRLLLGDGPEIVSSLPARRLGLAGEEIEPGLQILAETGRPLAWIGSPQRYSSAEWRGASTAGRRDIESSVRHSSFYSVLTHGTWVRVPSGRQYWISLDQPLEINYKVNNRFLENWSLSRELVGDHPDELQMEFGGLEPRAGEAAGDSDGLSLSPALGEGSSQTGLALLSYLEDQDGNRLIELKLSGPPARTFWEASGNRLRRVSHLGTVVLFLLLGVTGFTLLPAHRVLRVIALILISILFRFLLLRLEIPAIWVGGPLFEPAVFASLEGFGLFRSAGDFFLTSLFLLGTIYGVRKVLAGDPVPERTPAPEPEKGVSSRMPVKAGVVLLVLYLTFELCGGTVSRVVSNANPRLVGAQAPLFSLPVATLHVSLLMTLASIFILALYVLRKVVGRAASRENFSATFLAVLVIGVPALIRGAPHLAVAAFLLGLLGYSYDRVVRRNDVISIVFSSFLLVVLTASFVYFPGQIEYDRLRKNLVLERAAEYLQPEESWRYFVLEDVMAAIPEDVLGDGRGGFDVENGAFNLWANGTLSYLGYRCAYSILSPGDRVLSHFAVELPRPGPTFRFPAPRVTHAGDGWEIREITRPRKRGTLFSYLGVKTVRPGSTRVVVELPYFDENLETASLTGPRTPEVLRNIQPGAVAPRIEEESSLLLARLAAGRVTAASSPFLLPGTPVAGDPTPLDAAPSEADWREIELEEGKFQYVVCEGRDGQQLLAGFRSVRWFDILLEWSRILFLDLVIALALLAATFSLRFARPLRPYLPSVKLPLAMGFQQRLMGSFLLVSLLPTVALGIFSRQLVQNRFDRESRTEAIEKVRSAEILLANFIAMKAQQKFENPESPGAESGEGAENPEDEAASALLPVQLRPVSIEGVYRQDGQGGLLSGEPPIRNWPEGEPTREGTFVLFAADRFWGLEVRRDQSEENAFQVYYLRLGDRELGDLASMLGSDVNLYHHGVLETSSRRELYAGRFLSPFLPSEVIRRLSLSESLNTAYRDRTGTYEYHVGYLGLDSPQGASANVLSVPMLLRTESLQREIDRTQTLIVGLVTLLFAATLGLGLFLASRIFDPIQNLLAGTKKVAEGDLSFRIPAARRDEIGLLVHSFNRMTGSLKEARTELDKRRRYLETVMKGIASGVIATGEDGRIGAVNPAAERLLGVSSAELVGRSSRELAGGGAASDFFRVIERREEEGIPFEEEFAISRDNHLSTLKVAGTPLDPARKGAGFVIVLEDLTELIETKKLSAWAEMARQIAHEIKNPLTPMKLSAQFMSQAHRDRADTFDEIFTDGVDTIMRQIEILRKIASEFSTFGRVPRIEVEPVPLRAVLEESLKGYGREADGIKISFDAESCAPRIRVLADAEALRKIFVNLVENALEAMDGDGELRVYVEGIGSVQPRSSGFAEGEAAALPDGTLETAGTSPEAPGGRPDVPGERSYVRVVVLDSGPGIDPEVREKLFEPYFSTKTNGTGLGLAICKALVEQMGGRLTLQNVSARPGTLARISLRLEEAGQNGDVEREPEPRQGF